MLVCAAIVVAMGPFGAVPYRDWPARTLYWLRIMAMGYAVVRPCLVLASAVARRWTLSETLTWPAASVLALGLARAWPGDGRTRGVAAGRSAARTADGKPALARRLPPGHGAIFALSMEDHYVRVHAEGGQTLLLMRMADAVAAVDGLDGAQIHRSWWVARSAVERCERRGRRFWLLLPGGLPAPVARDRVKALIADGWPLKEA